MEYSPQHLKTTKADGTETETLNKQDHGLCMTTAVAEGSMSPLLFWLFPKLVSMFIFLLLLLTTMHIYLENAERFKRNNRNLALLTLVSRECGW